MARKKISRLQIVPLLRTSVDTLYSNPVIFLPFCTIAFFQLLILEVLFFAARYPLVTFFGPIIRRLWSESFLHYPLNFILLPKLFQYAKIPAYILVSNFCIATAIYIISEINNDRKISFGTAVKESLRYYIQVVFIAIISFFTFFILSNCYDLAIQRAMGIRSEAGFFYIMKRIIIDGAPYLNLLIGIFVTTIFSFVMPIMIIDRKKIHVAIFSNFKQLWRSYWFVFCVVFVPTFFYIPILLLRNNMTLLADTVPGIRGVILALSILIMIVIDATVYTAITTYYLVKKENR